MEKRDSWKRTEEIEIDLGDLFRKLCMQWKQIMICALFFAVIFGGYSYVKSREGAAVQKTDTGAEESLSEEEQQGVTAAVALEAEIRGLQGYLDGSVLMQIDPYQEHQVVQLYSISHAKKQVLWKTAALYEHFIANGGAADALKGLGNKAWDMDKRYLSELITVYQEPDQPDSRSAADDREDATDVPSENRTDANDASSESLFYVEITGADPDMADRLAADLQAVLEQYFPEAEEIAGSHKLTLLSSEAKVQIDHGLRTQQHDKHALLSTDLSSLKGMTDAFTEDQMVAYQQKIGPESEQDRFDQEKAAASADQGEGLRPKVSKRYILLGSVGGILLYCCGFGCWYLFRDNVRSAAEFKALYTFPYYGGISSDKRRRKGKKGVSGQETDRQRQEIARLTNRIRLVCKKQSIAKICLAAGTSITSQERAWMDDLCRQLREQGIEAVLMENVCGDIAVWDTLAEIGNVLLVCRMGTTTHRMIDEEMSFYQENGIAVAGAIAFI